MGWVERESPVIHLIAWRKANPRAHGPRWQAEVTPLVDDITLAWTAGIIEGEGTFYDNHGGVSIIVTQKDPWILEKLLNLYGGSIYTRKAVAGFSIDSIFYNWQLSGGKARGLATAIESYLSPRRQAQLKKARG